MKRNITLLSFAVMVSGLTIGQSLQYQQAKKSANSKLQFRSEVIKPQPLNTVEKAGGDIIWENGFEDDAEWTAAGPGSEYNTNGWSIGNTISNSWFFNTGNMGTTGDFARFANNSPIDGTEVTGGPFTLTFNGTLPDLTGVPVPHLEFEQYGAIFVERQEVQISMDNGVTWIPVSSNSDIQPLTAAGGSPYDRPMTRRFNIAPFLTGDITAVQIRLFWDGAMNGANMSYTSYGWFVDNVRIVEGYANDVKIGNVFNIVGTQEIQYTKIPSSQVNANTVVSFGAFVDNVGDGDLDVIMNVSNADGYDQNSSAVNVPSLETDSLSILVADGYAISSTPGVYDFTYTMENANPTLGLVATLDDASLVGGATYADATGVATTTNGSGTGLTVDITTATDGPVLTLDDASLVGGTDYVDATDVATTNGSGTGLTVDIIATTDGPVLTLDDASLNGGTGYAVAANVPTTGGLGSGLTVNIDEIADGLVSALDNASLNGGTGYLNALDVPTTGGSGTGLTVEITVNGSGVVVAVVVKQAGTGYVVGDVVTISGGGGDATIEVLAVESGVITTVAVDQGGTGYEVGDVISISGGNDDATIEVLTVESGVITTVAVNQGGTGYEVGDVITISGGNDDATIEVLTVDPSGAIVSVAVNQAGEGYEVGDVITIDGGDGNGTIEVLTVEDITLDNTNDDATVFPFEVTSKIMAIDQYDGTAGSFTGGFFGWAGGAADPGIGTYYEIFEDVELERVLVGIVALDAQTAAEYVGNSLFCSLYKLNPGSGELEFNAISITHEIQSNEFGRLVALQFEEPISLQAGDLIAPIAGFFSGADVPIAFAGKTIAGSVVGLADGGLIGLAPDDNGVTVDAPVVRLDFGTYLNIEESALAASDVNLYPNPASNNATIAFSLANESAVSVEVRDLAGKLIYSSNEGQLAAGSHELNLSTANMAEGMYTYTLTSGDAQITKKFVVKK